jgi:hypothetical protein
MVDRLYETIDFDRTNNRIPLDLPALEEQPENRAPTAAARLR